MVSILAPNRRVLSQALGASVCIRDFRSTVFLSTGSRVADSHDEKEAETDLFAAAIEEFPEANNYPLWLKKIRERLAVGSGPVYLGGKTPFPYNPEFRPRLPLRDSFQNLVYSVWESEPSKWTPRQLSIRFKISMERVKAIIKLKLLQRKMEAEGFQVSSDYVDSMEKYLGASDPMSPEAEVSNNYNVFTNMRPKLVAIPEESALTAQDAAKILGQKLKPLYDQVEAEIENNSPYNPIPAREDASNLAKLFIRNDPYERSRWRYVFTDISSSVSAKSREILVREPNGDLRRASLLERMSEGKRVWGEINYKRHVA